MFGYVVCSKSELMEEEISRYQGICVWHSFSVCSAANKKKFLMEVYYE